MNEFRLLILVLFFPINALDKADSVKLELKTFDEIFGEGWWDKGEAEDLKMPAPTNFGQNVHHQIDRQNTQIGQIEPNSTDQLGQIEPNSTDQIGQIEPNSTDQIGQIEPNSTDQLGQIEPNGQIEENIVEDERKQLGVSDTTIYIWKSELGQSTPDYKYPHSEQKELMKRWKRQFKRQQFHPNSAKNAAANVQAIGNSNLGII
uniref:Uncharacterized protein n=1 Tax=Globodera rostochiensis TaxID=31243 RepID=A0A914HQQ1_GLORO